MDRHWGFQENRYMRAEGCQPNAGRIYGPGDIAGTTVWAIMLPEGLR